MKTTALFSLIVTMLMLNVNTSGSINTLPEPIYKGVEIASIAPVNNLVSILEGDFEEMLDVHAWMLDENAFAPVFETEVIPVEEWMLNLDYASEPFTEVEDWMLNAELFEANESFFDETLEPVEEWMINLEAFSYEVQPMIEVEDWMLDVELFEANFEVSFEPVEDWMVNPDAFINSAEDEPMIEVEDWMLSLEAFEK